MHVIGTSPDQVSSRRSSLGSLNSTQKQRRQWRNGRRIAQSTPKTTSRPITSLSLNSAFYSYPGTPDTAGRPALPACTGGMPHPAVRAGIPHLVETQQPSARRLDVTDTGHAGREPPAEG